MQLQMEEELQQASQGGGGVHALLQMKAKVPSLPEVRSSQRRSAVNTRTVSFFHPSPRVLTLF